MKFEVRVCYLGYVFIGEPCTGKSVLSRLIAGAVSTDSFELKDLDSLLRCKILVPIVFTTTDEEIAEMAVEKLGGLVVYGKDFNIDPLTFADDDGKEYSLEDVDRVGIPQWFPSCDKVYFNDGTNIIIKGEGNSEAIKVRKYLNDKR